MRLFSIKHLLIFLSLIFISGVLFANTMHIVAPGESFNGTGLKSGTPDAQVSGVPFVLSVYSLNESNSYLPVTYPDPNQCILTSNDGSVVMTPSGATTMSLTDPYTSTPGCLYYVTVTAGTLSTGNVGYYANGTGGGALPGSVTINVQAISSFSFAATSDITAGENLAVYITAIDDFDNPVTGFNGTADLTIDYPSGNDVVYYGVQFVNGVYDADIPLYKAANGINMTIASSVPAGKTGNYSTSSGDASFDVNPDSAVGVLIVGPGQIYEPGTNTGTGRVGQSTQTSLQTAGTGFTVDVYAVDQYWNTDTSETSSVTLTCPGDGQAVIDTGVSFSSGSATFNVDLRTVDAGTQTLTASFDAFSGNDIVPLTHAGAVSSFGVPVVLTNQVAGTPFLMSAAAYDAYNNTVTSYNGVPQVKAYAGTSEMDTNNYGVLFNGLDTSFVDGIGTYAVRIYQWTSNATISFYDASEAAGGTSNAFSVSEGALDKLLLISPGETYDPGDNTTRGETGLPSSITVGAATTFSLYAADRYGNRIYSENGLVEITSTDSNATIQGSALPQYVTLTTGAATFNVVFETAGTMDITVSPVSWTEDADPDTDSLDVISSEHSYFTIENIPSSVTAGSSNSARIYARDVYGNAVGSYTGWIYMSSPDADYSYPYESTIDVSGTSVSVASHKWAIHFNGTSYVDVNVQMRRAMAQTLFVSDAFSDTPGAYSGHIGQSSIINVSSNIRSQYQVIPPGVEVRPGTADGENNSPTGQGQGAEFYVDVRIVDDYFNLASGNPLQSVITTSVPSQSQINDITPPVTYPISISQTVKVEYNNSSSSFYVEASSLSPGVIDTDISQNIQIYDISGFIITGLNNTTITAQTAGEKFWVSITAVDSNTDMVDFNGTANLSTNNTNSSSEFVVWPTTVSFTAGVCVTEITIYKTAALNGNEQLHVSFASAETVSDPFYIKWNTPTQLLTIFEGMTHEPGLIKVGIPGYYGYTGSPVPVKAGTGHTFEVYIVDAFYNRAWDLDETITITCPDSNFINGGGQVSSQDVVTNNGRYTTSSMAIVSVGDGTQTLQVSHGSYTNAETPSIRVYHAETDHFTVDAPTGPVLAGDPFNITITARDEFENVCDSVNDGEPFSASVNLSAPNSAQANTIYPKQYVLSEGVGVASIQLFKAIPETVQASSGSILTTSNITTTVNPNVFSRIYLHAPGMDLNKNGVYADEPPTLFPLNDLVPFNGSPTYTTITVNDAGHPASANNFTVYTCDEYGNIAAYPEAIGQTITVTTNDPHAPVVPPLFISGNNGIANVEFHTAMTGVSVTANISAPSIQGYTTPEFTTKYGDPYGIQVIVPGVVVDAGSGTIGASNWEWGLSGTPKTQIVGTPFDVTIQACDVYGNRAENVSSSVSLYSTDNLAGAYPGDELSEYITRDFVDGVVNTVAALKKTEVSIELIPIDNEPSSPLTSISKAPVSHAYVNVVTPNNLEFKMEINGVDPHNASYTFIPGVTITAHAYPSTFDMDVSLVLIDSGGVEVSAVHYFTLEAVDELYPSYTPYAGGGTLDPYVGNTDASGDFIYPGTFTQAGRFRIKVSPTALSSDVRIGWSPIIDMLANTTHVRMDLRAGQATEQTSLRANSSTVLTAYVQDINGNVVREGDVLLTINGEGSFDQATSVTSTVITMDPNQSDSNQFEFYTGESFGLTSITANYLGVSYSAGTDTFEIFQSLSEPELGTVSNYPNPFKAGVESTNIEYMLMEETDVIIKIYTLFGDLVFETEIREGDEGAIANRMNRYMWDGKNQKGVVVGNGGYICIVEAVIEGEKKKMVRKIAVAK